MLTLSLNAPYGARCFLTMAGFAQNAIAPLGLNAPYGARCFLTADQLNLIPTNIESS